MPDRDLGELLEKRSKSQVFEGQVPVGSQEVGQLFLERGLIEAGGGGPAARPSMASARKAVSSCQKARSRSRSDSRAPASTSPTIPRSRT